MKHEITNNLTSSRLTPMSKEETMRLFDKFIGSLKVPEDFDAKKEFLKYLDERYPIETQKND